MGKSTELHWGRNQLSRHEGLSLPEFADHRELQQCPHGNADARRHSCMESLLSVKESCKLTLHGPGTALAMGAARTSSPLPWQMGICHFRRPSGRNYGVLRHGVTRYNIKKLLSLLPAWPCNKPLIRHPASVRGSSAR